MLRSYILAFVAAFLSLTGVAQHQIRGVVTDADSRQPLAFVNIVGTNAQEGTTTGVDGRFVLESTTPIKELRLSYVGYADTTIAVPSGAKSIQIQLKSTSYNLGEVEILPGENPAHRIIKKVVQNRKLNNPEKACSFSYTSYNKMIFTADVDSALLVDTAAIASMKDTSEQRFMRLLKKQHLFLTEAVTERKFMPPDFDDEKVLASRASGFKAPAFSMLASQLQSFSFYDELLVVADVSYLNPISKGSTRKYLFVLEDTLWNANDTVFVISYRPRKGKNFEGLQGLLYINTHGYAVQNVIAEPFSREDGLSAKIQQKYERFGEQWFPIELNTYLIFRQAQLNNHGMVVAGWSYLEDIQINPPGLRKRDFDNLVLEMESMESTEAEKVISKYRVDSLSSREANTYHIVDSLGEAENFDARMQLISALSTGRWPVGWIDLDLNRIINYNDYEGFRLGAGIHTNDRISKWMKVGGYYAYGFRDKRHKFGGDLDLRFSKKHEFGLNLAYAEDVMETGGVSFFEDRVNDLTENYRQLFVNRMEWGTSTQAVLRFRALQHFKCYAFAGTEVRNTPANTEYLFYRDFDEVSFGTRNYQFTTAGISVRFGFREKFAQSGPFKVSLGSKYPIIWAKYTQGFSDLYGGEFDFSRIDVKLEKSFLVKGLGKTSFRAMAGYIDGDVPWTMQYTGRGVFRPYNVVVLNAFETMRINEFISDQYVSFFFQHSFENLLYKGEKFQPNPVLVTNIGFGSLNRTEAHQGVEFSTMEQGYFESGLVINDVLVFGLSSFGIGAFYRYGPYQLSTTADNLAIKFALGFKL